VDLGGKKFLNGDDCPNLADLMMYATASSFETMGFFRRLLGRHDQFKAWYKNMKEAVHRSHQPAPVKTKDVAVSTDIPAGLVADAVEEDYNGVGRVNLRILTLNYLFHVLAFTYAAFNGSR